MNSIAKMLQLGFIIIGCIVFGLIIGFIMDNWLNTNPLFKIVGLIAGAFLALSYLFYLASDERL